MPDIPDGHTLIRLWSTQANHTGHVIAAFDLGFTIPSDHPAAESLRNFCWLPDAPKMATVQSTPEFMWTIRTVHGSRRDRFLRVDCLPYVDYFRQCTESDEYFLNKMAGAGQ